MANSPGPSTSTAPNSLTPNFFSEDKKRKRIRRKPRTKVNKEIENNSIQENHVPECIPWFPSFAIENVKQQLGIVYKLREKSLAPIKLRTFVQNGVPVVFQTRTDCDLIQKFKKLTVNLCAPTFKCSSLKPQDKSPKEKKKKKKKEKDFFAKYLSENAVNLGLSEGELIKGFIRVNPKNFKESYVGNEDTTQSDYMIQSVKDRNRALDGDEVILKVKSVTEEKKKLVEVVYITQKFATKEEVKSGLESGKFFKGFLRIGKFCQFAFVDHEDESCSDFLIETALDRNRALHGDEVILTSKMGNMNYQQDVMTVVAIKRKIHPRTAVGFLQPLEKNKEYALFTPRDRRIPKMKIHKTSWPSGFQAEPKLYTEILFLAKITEWREVKFALGTILENLGLNGDLKVESLAILREFCLDPTPYGEDIKQFLPKTNEIPRHEIDNRKDIRKECVFTIDPVTARDLDDALSCKELANGNLEIGVHISDASFFLNEKTKLDQMVKTKATTIYMVDNVYHMLPEELCLHCSLLPGEDKLSFSIFWEMTPEAEIVNQQITRTVMNSCAQLAYEHAQMMIDEPARVFKSDELPDIHNGHKPEDLSKIVNNLQKIAVQLRDKRKKNGSLRIDQVKISFALDPATGEPRDFWVYENKPAHRLIEEFMLLANMSVAKFINDAFPDLAFLRTHEPPKPSMMIELQRNLETIGMHIDISTSGRIQASLDKYTAGSLLGEARMMVLNHLLAKPMKRARYFCAGATDDDVTTYTHFALSIPIYTHFTSPIRRYADIVVHRLLAASLNYCKKPKWKPEEVAAIAENCNRQKYHSKRAQESSLDLYLAHFIENNQPYIQEAVIVDTKERSIDVIVLNTGSVVRIYVNNFGEKVKWTSEQVRVERENEENCKKIWRILVKFPANDKESETVMVLEMFTVVRVALTRKAKTNQLEAKLLRPL